MIRCPRCAATRGGGHFVICSLCGYDETDDTIDPHANPSTTPTEQKPTQDQEENGNG